MKRTIKAFFQVSPLLERPPLTRKLRHYRKESWVTMSASGFLLGISEMRNWAQAEPWEAAGLQLERDRFSQLQPACILVALFKVFAPVRSVLRFQLKNTQD